MGIQLRLHPSFNFLFADLVKAFHIVYVLILLWYNYLLETENKLHFTSTTSSHYLLRSLGSFSLSCTEKQSQAIETHHPNLIINSLAKTLMVY